MNPDLIAAAVLFGPGALAAPVLAYRVITTRRDTDTIAAVLAEHRTTHHDAGTTGTPPGGGQPQPAPADLAAVIPFPTRHAA
jgi:hypothetical protein